MWQALKIQSKQDKLLWPLLIGALVLAYCRWYFKRTPVRVLGLLTAFAGAMLGLVTADDLPIARELVDAAVELLARSAAERSLAAIEQMFDVGRRVADFDSQA